MVLDILWTSLVVQMVKNLPAMPETWVQSLEEEMATLSSILAWRIPRTKEPGGLQSMGSLRIGHDGTTNFTSLSGYSLLLSPWWPLGW